MFDWLKPYEDSVLILATILNVGGCVWGYVRLRVLKHETDRFFAVNELLLLLCTRAWTLREHKPLFRVYDRTVARWWDEEADKEKDDKR